MSIPIYYPTVIRRRESGLSVTSFTQSVGSELLTNGDFASWSGDDPAAPWFIIGESGSDPAISEVAPDGSAGTGAARIYTSVAGIFPFVLQDVAIAAGDWVEGELTATVVTSGKLILGDTVGGDTILSLETVGTASGFGRENGTTLNIYPGGSSADIVITRASAKKITLNAARTMPAADGTHTQEFTRPVTPRPGHKIQLWYRCAATNGDINNWRAEYVRNSANTDWNVRLYSVSAGTITTRLSVDSVGDADAVRVVTNGTTHTVYTGVGGVFTQRGSPVTVPHLDTETGIRAVYSSVFTPVRLTSFLA